MTVLDDMQEAEKMETALLGHYNCVAGTLKEDLEQHRPLLVMDERTEVGVVWTP